MGDSSKEDSEKEDRYRVALLIMLCTWLAGQWPVRGCNFPDIEARSTAAGAGEPCIAIAMICHFVIPVSL